MTAPARAPAGRASTARSGSAAAGQPRLRLVPAPALRPPRTPFVALVVGLLGAGLVVLLLLNTAIAEDSFRLHALQQRTGALDLQRQQLQREIDDLEAPGALSVQARRLGMVPAGNPAFIRLRDGRILGVPTPGKAPPPPPAPRPAPTPTPSPGTAAATPKPSASPAPAASPAAHR